MEGEESEGVARLCIECHVGVVNPNSLTPVTNVTIDVGVATPFTVHPSTLSYPCIGKPHLLYNIHIIILYVQ